MSTPLNQKSSLSEIEERFEKDVERFSSLETGQSTTVDAPLAMELITEAAVLSTPDVVRILDIGCGAGNTTIQFLRRYVRDVDCDLNDLSRAMLTRAEQRVASETRGRIRTIHGDFRAADLPEGGYDVIFAAAVLHHLREEEDWWNAFSKIYRLLKPGGSFWITDMVSHEIPGVQKQMWRRYGEYLAALGGEACREKVFAYIDKEDSPRPVSFQLNLLRKVGFDSVDILHKNSCFCAFGAIKGKSTQPSTGC